MPKVTGNLQACPTTQRRFKERGTHFTSNVFVAFAMIVAKLFITSPVGKLAEIGKFSAPYQFNKFGKN